MLNQPETDSKQLQVNNWSDQLPVCALLIIQTLLKQRWLEIKGTQLAQKIRDNIEDEYIPNQ